MIVGWFSLIIFGYVCKSFSGKVVVFKVLLINVLLYWNILVSVFWFFVLLLLSLVCIFLFFLYRERGLCVFVILDKNLVCLVLIFLVIYIKNFLFVKI